MSIIKTLHNRLADALPSPQLRVGTSGAARKPVTRIILFGRYPNPTSDYYFSARLAAPGMPPSQLVDIRDKDLGKLDPDGAFVIFCRYASKPALDWIETHADRLAGVGLFLDDDIPAVIASTESSIRYKLSLFLNALWPLKRLNRHLDIVWASTPPLAERLAGVRPRLLPPAPARDFWDTQHAKASDPPHLLIAYHATGIHVEEHHFLLPVMREVLAARPNIRFEIFADRKTAHLWRDMSRVTLRKALPWSDYVEEGKRRPIDIMLVPLSPSAVNDCRSATKRIDVARAGAAGIFSVSAAYGNPDQSGEIRIPYDRETWRRTIMALIDDPSGRARAAEATRSIVGQMTLEADKGLCLGSMESIAK